MPGERKREKETRKKHIRSGATASFTAHSKTRRQHHYNTPGNRQVTQHEVSAREGHASCLSFLPSFLWAVVPRGVRPGNTSRTLVPRPPTTARISPSAMTLFKCYDPNQCHDLFLATQPPPSVTTPNLCHDPAQCHDLSLYHNPVHCHNSLPVLRLIQCHDSLPVPRPLPVPQFPLSTTNPS
ncbi:hypothetical protein E2C01_086351 [Portunus trituberculatus]|uniref:Uncharacterized protein n=1 Tax=Portunus trituberculatus TaxID=210409 RepID=A0A5B7JA28_PORTR|nr:hypothetical protein [Portunus trituberculatus]